MKNKLGVFLARMQPLHIAHMYLVEKALEENERVAIVLGSANKEGMIRNPFDLETRTKLLHKVLRDKKYSEEDINRITVFELPDWSYENDTNETLEWGRYLYYNIVSRTQTKKFSIYYSDDAEIIKNWFKGVPEDRITLRLFNRSNVYEGLSATKIREAILNEDQEYLEKYIPLIILDDVIELTTELEAVTNNPKEDFSM